MEVPGALFLMVLPIAIVCVTGNDDGDHHYRATNVPIRPCHPSDQEAEREEDEQQH